MQMKDSQKDSGSLQSLRTEELEGLWASQMQEQILSDTQ